MAASNPVEALLQLRRFLMWEHVSNPFAASTYKANKLDYNSFRRWLQLGGFELPEQTNEYSLKQLSVLAKNQYQLWLDSHLTTFISKLRPPKIAKLLQADEKASRILIMDHYNSLIVKSLQSYKKI